MQDEMKWTFASWVYKIELGNRHVLEALLGKESQRCFSVLCAGKRVGGRGLAVRDGKLDGACFPGCMAGHCY